MHQRPCGWTIVDRLRHPTFMAVCAPASGQRLAVVVCVMRQIIEEWVRANRETPAPDRIGELVRHLDAARRAADALVRRAG